MASTLYDILLGEVRVREDHALVTEWDNMARIFEGILPPEYDRYFPQNHPKQIINMIRLAWDDLATQVGRLPDLRGDALNNSNAEEKRVALHERIGHNYFRMAEPSGKMLMYQNAWWLVGIGRSVVVVTPDDEQKQPIMSIRDPRTAWPEAAKTAGNQIVKLKNIIFKYELSAKEMENRNLKQRGESTNQWGEQEKPDGIVLEYIDDEKWIVASEGTTHIAYHNLGTVPAWVFQSFSPNKKAGLSQFQDQVTLMVSISRLISQKLRFADRLVHPVYWVRGYEGTIELGPDVINKLGPTGEMGQLNPPATLQVDRDIEKLEQFSRILNRNPEVRQGEVNAKSYTSAKTLEQLSEAIDTVVGRQWDITSVGFSHLMHVCYRMDEKMWPNTEKPVKGVIRNQKFSEHYIPSKDIAGRWDINVDYGFGMGGYQGFLQQLQAKGEGMQSKRRAMEQMPGVSDVDDLMREIELETMDDAATANFAALAAQGQLDMILWAELRKEMAVKGIPLADVILKYQTKLQEQAQAAQAQGGADALTAAPAPEGEAPPQEQALPGISPAAMIG